MKNINVNNNFVYYKDTPEGEYSMWRQLCSSQSNHENNAVWASDKVSAYTEYHE